MGLCAAERQHISVSWCGCQRPYFCAPCVSALLSLSLVCLVAAVAVWVGESLCVSEPWGWRAEQLQVATGKSKQVRVGGCEVGRGWMKANEYTEESQQGGLGGVEGRAGRRREVGVLPVSLIPPSPGLTVPA